MRSIVLLLALGLVKLTKVSPTIIARISEEKTKQKKQKYIFEVLLSILAY